MSIERILDVESWAGGEPKPVGEGFDWKYKGSSYCILYTRVGMYRGNHIHPNTQYTMLLDGKGKYRTAWSNCDVTASPAIRTANGSGACLIA